MPYETSSDGTLSCSLSTKIDDAGSSMLRFFQEHMVVILRPINEHINELYMKHHELGRSLGVTNKALEKTGERLDRHDLDLEGLHSKHGLLEAEMKRMLKELKGTDLSLTIAALEAEARASKKTRSEIDDRMFRIVDDMQAVRSSLDESNAYIHRVDLKVWQTASLTERLERETAELCEDRKPIADRHLALSRGIEQINHAHENTRKAVVKLTGDVDATRVEVSSTMKSLEPRIKGLEDFAASTAPRLDSEEQKLASLSESLGFINSNMQELTTEIHQLEEENAKQDEDLASAQQRAEKALAEEMKKQVSVLERIKEVEAAMVKVKTALAKEMEKNIPNLVRDLTSSVERHGLTINQHTGTLKSLETAITPFEPRILNLESRAGDTETAQVDLAKRADLAQDNIRELLAFCKTAESRIDNHHVELEKMEVYTSTTRHALGQTNAAVQHLHGDLGTTKGGLASAAIKLDLAHEYLHGMSKGLQETHKLSITGQDGLLAPKHGLSRTRPLPMIGQPGRPASAQRGKTSPGSTLGGAETPTGVQMTA